MGSPSAPQANNAQAGSGQHAERARGLSRPFAVAAACCYVLRPRLSRCCHWREGDFHSSPWGCRAGGCRLPTSRQQKSRSRRLGSRRSPPAHCCFCCCCCRWDYEPPVPATAVVVATPSAVGGRSTALAPLPTGLASASVVSARLGTGRMATNAVALAGVAAAEAAAKLLTTSQPLILTVCRHHCSSWVYNSRRGQRQLGAPRSDVLMAGHSAAAAWYRHGLQSPLTGSGERTNSGSTKARRGTH